MFNLSGNNRTFFIIILIIAVLGIGVGFPLLQNKQQSNNSTSESQNTQQGSFTPVASNVMVYGTWSGQNSLVKAFDLQSGKTSVLASLPQNSKKVTVLSPDKLLYISNTDAQDHGASLSTYSTSSKKSTAVYTAPDGFGIDDYVVSPDKQYIAVWEVKFAPNSGVLLGGQSRVTAMKVDGTSAKNLYDEVANAPVHYPSAITNTGEVFMDTFMPNSVAGWAYGMSVSDFTGSTKQDLADMQNGTYGTRPTASPDGKYLAFAGYDGAYGDGKASSSATQIREAILRSDTVELLDTQTLQRQKLPNLSNTNTYSDVSWDPTTGNLIFSVIAPSMTNSGYYQYDLKTQKATKLDLGNQSTPGNVFLSSLSNGKYLVGTPDQSDSSLGNLGNQYATALDAVQSVGNTTTTQNQCQVTVNGKTYPCSQFPIDTTGKVSGSTATQTNSCNVTVNGQQIPCSNTTSINITGTPSGVPTSNPGSSSSASQPIVQCNLTINGQKQDCASLPTQVSNITGVPSVGCTIQVSGSNFSCDQFSQYFSKAFQSLPITINDSYMQYITTLPGTFFKGVLGSAVAPTGTQDYGGCDQANLQLCTLSFKPSLAPQREAQQSAPAPSTPTSSPSGKLRCKVDIAEPKCKAQGYQEGTVNYTMCVAQTEVEYRLKGACYDSPLYLYGTTGQQVKVQVKTPIYSDVPTSGNGYDVTLLSGGNLQVGGSSYPSIAYDYNPGIKRITPPSKGVIVSQADAAATLKTFASRLGLNARETADLITYGKEHITSPYVFISFFDEKTSEQILPLSFTPEPETYQNIVFYFKQLSGQPSYTPVPPVFPTVPNRTGLTAIEISGIVE